MFQKVEITKTSLMYSEISGETGLVVMIFVGETSVFRIMEKHIDECHSLGGMHADSFFLFPPAFLEVHP